MSRILKESGVAPDLEKSVDFYRQVLGFEGADAYEIPYGVINDAFALPPDTLHRLQTTCVGRRVNVEVDQYPADALPRKIPPGELPPAMSMVSFVVDDLGPLEPRALGPIREREEMPCLGRRALTLRGGGRRVDRGD